MNMLHRILVTSTFHRGCLPDRSVFSSQFLRTCASKSVRVRFAPSPTGFLHLGSLRTALYNYLFALSKQGQMVLRIEDTDQARTMQGTLEALLRDLKWAGIAYHEGPLRGGSFGPYIQSERSELYAKHVQTLLSNGSAYKCFCSDKRLDLLRRDAVRTQQVPKYDNKCRYLSADDIKTNLDAGKPYCVRFKLTSDILYFDDIICGTIAYDVASVEADPIIMKSDGLPTYHLANVVDDHLMEITHVLRGVEWQISTTKHLLMYRAFGWSPPLYGHLPLILNPDGTKLSKRQDNIRVEEIRKSNIYPLALINYLTMAGGGFDHVPGEGVQIHTIDELAKQFDLDKVNVNSTKLNPDLLIECNRLEIKERLSNEDGLNATIDAVQKMVREHYSDQRLDVSLESVSRILKWASGRLTTLNELISPSFAFVWVLPSNSVKLDKVTQHFLLSLVEEIENKTDTLEQDELKQLLFNFCKTNSVKFNKCMKVLRTVLSGLPEGPSVAEMILLLGKNESLQRIRDAVHCQKQLE